MSQEGRTQDSKVSKVSSILNKGNRIARKFTEKERRDKLAGYIRWLGESVPFINRKCCYTQKKLDLNINEKLRLIISFLECTETDAFVEYKTKQLTKYLLDLASAYRSELIGDDSVFLCDSSTKFLIVDDETFKDLGYRSSDLIGNKLTEILVPKEDLKEFKLNLDNIKKQFWSEFNNCLPTLKCYHRLVSSFNCCLLYNQEKGPKSVQYDPRSLPIQRLSTFEIILTIKIIKRKPSPQYNRVDKGNHHIHLKLVKIPDGNDDSQLGIFGRIKPIAFERHIHRHSIFTTKYDQYTIYCNPAGMILDTDLRIFLVLGLNPKDVMRQMAHMYIHEEDLLIALFNHKELIFRRSGVQQAVYRLWTAYETYIYIKSFGRLYLDEGRAYEKLLLALDAIQISEQEGIQLLAEERKRVASLIGNLTIDDLRNLIKTGIEEISKTPVTNMLFKSQHDNFSEDVSSTCSTFKTDVQPACAAISTPQVTQVDVAAPNLSPTFICNQQCWRWIRADQAMFTTDDHHDGNFIIPKIILVGNNNTPDTVNASVPQLLPNAEMRINLEPLLNQCKFN